jgi:hypothetical protein
MKENEKYCPYCERETYFSGNTCRCCHFNFSEWELTHNSIIHPVIKHVEYLCDSCVYDWRASCQVPERPNVPFCAKYKKEARLNIDHDFEQANSTIPLLFRINNH